MDEATISKILNNNETIFPINGLIGVLACLPIFFTGLAKKKLIINNTTNTTAKIASYSAGNKPSFTTK